VPSNRRPAPGPHTAIPPTYPPISCCPHIFFFIFAPGNYLPFSKRRKKVIVVSSCTWRVEASGLPIHTSPSNLILPSIIILVSSSIDPIGGHSLPSAPAVPSIGCPRDIALPDHIERSSTVTGHPPYTREIVSPSVATITTKIALDRAPPQQAIAKHYPCLRISPNRSPDRSCLLRKPSPGLRPRRSISEREHDSSQ